MAIRFSGRFEEFLHGSFYVHLYRFSVDEFDFVVIFSPVDTTDAAYSAFRSTEAGFRLPEQCYDLKFDREDNFLNSTFYQIPERGMCSRRYGFVQDLAIALQRIVTLHYHQYAAKVYFMIAENNKLKRYYDRILQHGHDNVLSEIKAGLGEGGKGYVLKTRHF
ncbi:hypothetical protein [Morganella morganii]|uniref:hypothetical protein n=1 Tax=Morganella morganii TaxID=582 RepID=UPI00090EEF35|nr:hypothetical protein [Morganella morganii]SHM38141.1 hypothetical protein SAMN05216301_2214 [Morganella morganii]HAS8350455.1 hypothetical protein [Vibrio vulnificus]